MITAVALSPSVDVTYVVDTFSPGAINRPSAVHRVAGGKGLNAARAAHLLGADVAAVAILGTSNGTWFADELARVGLPLYRVDGGEPTRTCVSIADENKHTMTEIYEHPGRVTDDEWSALGSAVAAAVADRPGWLTISGSLPRGAPEGALSALVGLARQANCWVAVDLHGDALSEALTGEPDLVKVNAEEAAEMLRAGPEATPLGLAKLLAGRARSGAVVTAGVDGAYGVSDSGSTRHVRSATLGTYPVGSGDCLLGGLVAGLDDGRDLLDSPGHRECRGHRERVAARRGLCGPARHRRGTDADRGQLTADGRVSTIMKFPRSEGLSPHTRAPHQTALHADRGGGQHGA
ncbi:1-phosphofructokinase family hexose kinase [Actinophytocola sp.]|uniref:1-phosphofructokinase family hexose kinase n=1 Tax=Actinophytocola sp. TaxID=1872138 RepID=UPI003D6AB722